jgi:uncharacterized protein (UPF0335 family)
LKKRIEAKIKQINDDIEAISNGEMLSVYKGKPHPKEQEIKFQKWRIDVLNHIKNLREEDANKELERLRGLHEKEKNYETLVIIDLYRLALGVI